MGLFTNNKQLEKKVEDLKLTKQLEAGKLKKELATKDAEISRLQSKLGVADSKIEDISKERDYFKSLENDREALEANKRVVKIEREDLAEDKKALEHKESRLTKREERLEALENDEYKKGYSDGLADGLRKAHDITREDRKYLTMIAMSTNSSAAIESSQKALAGGFKDDSADSKSK